MKKIALIMIFGCLVLASAVFAEDDLIEPINPDAQGRGLINTDVSGLNNKVSELERRVNDLERDRRSTQDQVRQLDREINDIKRKF